MTSEEEAPQQLNPFMGTSPTVGEEPHESAPDPQEAAEEQALADEVTAVQRARTIVQAGVDTDHPLGKVFVRALERSESWKDSAWTPEEVRATAKLYEVPMRGD